MSDKAPLSAPPRTLLGLGPPDPEPGDEPGDEPSFSARNVPETIRPWALPDEERGAAGEGPMDIGLPLRPVLPPWLKIPLAAAALVSAAGLGLALGRGPLSPPAAATASAPRQSTSEDGARGARAAAVDARASAAAAEPTDPRVEARPEPPESPPRGRASASPEAHHRGPSPVVRAAPNAPLSADQARIESVAKSVHLEETDGGSERQATEPDGG